MRPMPHTPMRAALLGKMLMLISVVLRACDRVARRPHDKIKLLFSHDHRL
jgi:hypothetical protein